ncbi:uncharacterized protein NEMAJ01_1737 [Nematocida major]|uniref:uncharacterized protein n=1 Tax=Nematocida major TaxID=1912982 RepID=UPI002008AC0B|nr:uncharacterized protein NEMAJ01_1737 [Nematocida major]KAH9386841.1 hypothetical protein NEMAJ01_1737 [Nematocida major]
MKSFYSVVVTEYKDLVKTYGSIPCIPYLSIFALLVLFLMHSSRNKFLIGLVEARYFGFLLGNIAYPLAVWLGFNGPGFMFAFGGFLCEASGYIFRDYRSRRPLFIFSSIFVWFFYIFLLLSFSIKVAVPAALAASFLSLGYSRRTPLVYIGAQTLCESMLLAMVLTGAVQCVFSKGFGMHYIEKVKPLVCSAIFSLQGIYKLLKEKKYKAML